MARRKIEVLFVRLALLRRQIQPKLAEFHNRTTLYVERHYGSTEHFMCVALGFNYQSTHFEASSQQIYFFRLFNLIDREYIT